MYDFFYNKLIKRCGRENIELLFSDTDSFCFHVADNTKFENEMGDMMDYSNYPSNHRLYDESRKSQLGFFKDEISADSFCTEFVGLHSKCYALNIKNKKTNETYEKKVCKGLGRTAITNRLKFSEYKKCLFQKKDIRHYYTGIVSKKHNLFTVVRCKKALNCFDSKRFIYNCGRHSSPLGSILIKKYGNKCYKCRSRN
ncbi:MAG: hypothetical protein Q8O25_10220 [Sulfurisoma sp.]|nr:hypothetical protein [Sulfurisoma sp.]